MQRSTLGGLYGPSAASAVVACTLAVSCVALVDLDDLSSHQPEPSSAGSDPPGATAAGDVTDEGSSAGAGGATGSGPSDGVVGGGGPVTGAGAGGGPDLEVCDLPWGGTLLHNQSVTAYQSPSAPWGGACESETRICIDGALSGSFAYDDCEPAGPSYQLVGSSKTIGDCLDIAGEPVEIAAGDYVCKRSDVSCTDSSCACWSGWSQYESWSTTEAITCTGGCCGATYSPTTLEHSWADIKRETSTYYKGPNNCGLPPNLSQCDEKKCYAKVTELGCN